MSSATTPHPLDTPRSEIHLKHSVKKRASLACHNCRSRKVKCDLVEAGSPCHNCQLDNVECTTSLSKRTRQYRLQRAQQLRSSASRPTLLPREQSQQAAPSVSSLDGRSSGVARESSTQLDHNQTPPHDGSVVAEDSYNQPSNVRESYSSSKAELSSALNTAHEHTGSLNLPSYIRRPQHCIKPEELAYMRQCGALSVPDTALREQLILSFVLYVNPFLPVIDLQEFIDGVEGKPGGEISLILFQAVMFAGTAFVDLQFLLDAGFPNRMAARSYFFEKIKLLYDFGWEPDRVVLIQATLLHAYWYVSTNDQKDPWYWMGICISLATGIGLNLASTHTSLDTKMSRLWRRIWWTCVSRDRIMCLMTRRPIRIKDDDINLPPLKFKDFDTQPLSTKISVLQDSPLVNDCVCKVMLADIFMSKLSLLLISGRIFTHLYNLQRFDSSTSEWAMFYAPKRQHDLDLDGFERLKEELYKWSQTLNTYCQINYHEDDSPGGTPESPTSSRTVLLVHRAALKLLRLTTEEALLRPLTFPAGLHQRPFPVQEIMEDGQAIKARACVSQIASEMLEIFRDFRQKNLLGYLPPLSVGSILTAVASFLVDIRLAKKDPADVPRHQYHDCILSLQRLREVWPITEGTCAMVKQMATNNQIWFARCLKMLAKPMSTTEESPSDLSPNSTNQYNQSVAQSSHMNCSSEGEAVARNSSAGAHHFNYSSDQNRGHTGPQNNQVSTYLASMYPFPWTADDFDIFDPSTYRDLFEDHHLDAFDISGPLENNISAYPSSMGQTVEDSTEMSNTILPSGWR